MKEWIRWFWVVLTPPLIVIGTLGNFLAIIVCVRKTMRQYAFSLCLIVLAVADTLVLHVGLWRWWLFITYSIELRSLSNVICQGQLFLLYSSADCSCWTVCVVTLQRFVSVWLPTKAKLFTSHKSSVICLVVVVFLAFMKNGHLVVTAWKSGPALLTNYTLYPGCAPVDANYYNFMLNYWILIDHIFSALLPFLVLAICNGLIICKMVNKHQRTRKNKTGNENRDGKIRSMNIMLTLNSTVFTILSYFRCM